jgi:hypothetical protein
MVKFSTAPVAALCLFEIENFLHLNDFPLIVLDRQKNERKRQDFINRLRNGTMRDHVAGKIDRRL